jgi:hypothetical protein
VGRILKSIPFRVYPEICVNADVEPREDVVGVGGFTVNYLEGSLCI